MSATNVLAAPPRAATTAFIDPPLVFVALFAGLCAFPSRLLGDPDTHWHLAVGRQIWARGAVPWTDELSHTFAGAPWIAKEWLSQLLMAGAGALAGWPGVALMAALTVAATFALLFAWLARRLRAEAAAALALPAAMFCAPHFLARPHVFAFLTLFLWTRGLVDAVERGRTPPAWLLVVLALWTNLHGSFVVAYPIAGLLGLEALWRAWPEARMGVALRWAGFGALALAAGCASPYGIHALGVTATLFGSGEPLPFIQEWAPLGWGPVGIAALGWAAVLAVGLACGGVRNLPRLVLLALLAAMMIRHSRFLDVFAIVAPVVAAGPIAHRFGRFRAPDGAGDGGSGRWPALLPVGVVALAFALANPPRPAAETTPRAALDAARRLGVSGPVYNHYDFGGFLIAEGVPTFIDGRTDQLFLGGFISGLFKAARAETGEAFEALLDRHGVTWALVKHDAPERRHLDASAKWRVAHLDPEARLYVRR